MVALCHRFFSVLSLWIEDDDRTLAQQSRHDQINSLHPTPIQESHSDMKPQHWGRAAKILEEIQPPRTCLSIPCNVGLICTMYFFWSIQAVPSRDDKNYSQVIWIFQLENISVFLVDSLARKQHLISAKRWKSLGWYGWGEEKLDLMVGRWSSCWGAEQPLAMERIQKCAWHSKAQHRRPNCQTAFAARWEAGDSPKW